MNRHDLRIHYYIFLVISGTILAIFSQCANSASLRKRLTPTHNHALRKSTKPRAIMAEQTRSDWMSGHYGVMTHFLPCVTTIDQFNQVVDAFDVDAYASDVAQTGASYAIFTLGQGSYFCSPNDSLTKRCGNVTSHRDLLSDVAKALRKRGIRTIVYIPSGAPVIMAEGTHYKNDAPTERQAEFQSIWQQVITEYSVRYGHRVSGWWLDGMYNWQTMYSFTNGPGYRTLAEACRSGNPNSVVSFNDGGGPYSNHSQYGDAAAGEIHRHEQSLPEYRSRWVSGVDPATGHSYRVQWNVHTFLGHEFVGNGFGGPLDSPRFPDSYVADYVKRTVEHGGTCQFDVPIHMGGCNDPDPKLEGHLGAAFLPQLRNVAEVLKSKSASVEPGVNIAVNCQATTNLPGSSTPANGNDDDVDTDFASSENDVDVPYWQIDLGTPKPIAAVELVLSKADGQKQYRNEFQVLASDVSTFQQSDRIAWMMEGLEAPQGGSFLAFAPNPKSYRYVRVTRPPKDYHVYWWKPGLKFAELRVLGYKAP